MPIIFTLFQTADIHRHAQKYRNMAHTHKLSFIMDECVQEWVTQGDYHLQHWTLAACSFFQRGRGQIDCVQSGAGYEREGQRVCASVVWQSFG